MPFVLCNAPATFEHLMEQVLVGLFWHGVHLHIDDIIAFNSTWAAPSRGWSMFLLDCVMLT